MAILKAARRAKLPKSSFGLPGSRKYPMPDKAHAANAKARATQQVAKGNLSPAGAAQIRAKANRVLGSGAISDRQAERHGLTPPEEEQPLEQRIGASA